MSGEKEKVASRFRSSIDTLKQEGVLPAMKTILIGPAAFEALKRLPSVEPMLSSSIAFSGLTELELLFAQCNDIYGHLPLLYRTSADHRLREALELGTRGGESTLALLHAARRIDGRVTSVDLHRSGSVHDRVDEAGLASYWTFIQSDDLGLAWDRSIDHLFVDTSHAYDHTIRELQKYEPLVRHGGVISMHDTTSQPDVWRAIQDYFHARDDVSIFRYFHNNGLAQVLKH